MLQDVIQAIEESRAALKGVYEETHDRAVELNAMADSRSGYTLEEVQVEYADTIEARVEVNTALLAARDRFVGWLTDVMDGVDGDTAELRFRQELGANIIPAWRNAEGLSLREAAEVLGLAASTLSRWESKPDERWPTWQTAVDVVPRMHLGDPALLPLNRKQSNPSKPYPFPDMVHQRKAGGPELGGQVRIYHLIGVTSNDSDEVRTHRWETAKTTITETIDGEHLTVEQLEMLARLARAPEALDTLRFPPLDPLRQALDPVLGRPTAVDDEAGDDA